MKHKHHEDKTLQDDRTSLELDAHDDSPLVAGEGAPLAEDTVATEPPESNVVVAQSMLGGAPIASVLTPHGDDPAPHDPIATRDDRPIGD